MTVTSPTATGRTDWIDVGTAPSRPRASQWVPATLVGIVLVGLVVYAAMNPRFEWFVVAQYLFSFPILQGLGLTILLGVICMAIGIVVGTVVALMRASDFAPLRWASNIYIGFFRAIPPLVQLLFWFNLAYLQPTLFGVSMNFIITPMIAAIIGLSLHESAYQAEIMRAGFLSVPGAQRDAAKALGLSGTSVFFRVILPQALVAIIPPTGSQFVGTMKAVSLVSVLGLTDLLHSAEIIFGRTYQVVPLLIVVCIWYIVLVSLLQYLQSLLEARVQRGLHRSPGVVRTRTGKRGTH